MTTFFISATIIFVALTIFFFYKKFSTNDTKLVKNEEESSIEEEPIDEINIKNDDIISTSSISTIEESVEEMHKRLALLTNPDSEKPFAKISVPDTSEISNINEKLTSVTQENSVKPKKPKSKKPSSKVSDITKENNLPKKPKAKKVSDNDKKNLPEK